MLGHSQRKSWRPVRDVLGAGVGVFLGFSGIFWKLWVSCQSRPTEVRRLRDPSAGEDGREHLGAHHLRLPHHRLHDPLLVRGSDYEVRGQGCRRLGYSSHHADGVIGGSWIFLAVALPHLLTLKIANNSKREIISLHEL